MRSREDIRYNWMKLWIKLINSIKITNKNKNHRKREQKVQFNVHLRDLKQVLGI